jgi:hypothetical protein
VNLAVTKDSTMQEGCANCSHCGSFDDAVSEFDP